MRKICYVMTVFSKLTFFFLQGGGGGFPWGIGWKGESKRHSCRQSVLNCFRSRVPELSLMYGRKDSHLRFQLKLNEQIASISPFCLASLSTYSAYGLCHSLSLIESSNHPFCGLTEMFLFWQVFVLFPWGCFSFSPVPIRISHLTLLSKPQIFLQLTSCF